MDVFSQLALGASYAFQPYTLFYCLLGVTVGTFVGVLPGIGATTAVSMLLPLTFYLDPATALVMLAGIYYGAEYGGSIASILLNLPGTASTAVTCLDGHPMAKQGRAGVALMATAIASFIGGSIGIIALIFFSPVLASFALSFAPADYFAVMALGLLASAAITQGSPIKGIAMIALGVLFGAVGTDVNTGVQRFTGGVLELFEGISLVAVAMGLFGVSEVIASVVMMRNGSVGQKVGLRDMLPTREDVRRSVFPILRGSGIGAVLGALPGTGPTIAAYLSYAAEKRIARDPSIFGKGAIEGVAAPEAANNSAAQTAFIPTLTLGIPGTATMALMLGALMIQGIPAGPRLMFDHADIFWTLVVSFWIGNLLLVILNMPLIGIWVRLLTIPYRYLYPAIICLICIGAFSVSMYPTDVIIVLMFGVLGYCMRLLGFEPAPLLMGFILGPLMEQHFRRAMLLSHGDMSVFLERPISATLLGMTALLIAWSLYRRFADRRAAASTT